MKQLYLYFILLFFLSKAIGQTANTTPLPAGETVIGGHLHVGAANEVWTDAGVLYFNYRGSASATHFWNLGEGAGKSIMSIFNTGMVGIGTLSPSHPLTVKPISDIDAISWQRSADGMEVGRLGVTGGSGTARYGWIGLWSNNAVQTVQIDAGGGKSFINSGNVGIGTTSPKNLLDVNGTIHAREVKVDLNGWSDFVFQPTYKLKSLIEVEKYIKANGHLEDIPSAKEVEKNGVNMGEMQAKLLQKIEELTLYVIEKDKEIDTLRAEKDKQIEELKQAMVEIKKEIDNLK